MKEIKFLLNGELVCVNSHHGERLLDVLRNQFGLVGVKEGCGEGECGACAILINHRVVNSCILPLANVANQEVLTIEGFSKTKQYQVIQDAYLVEGAVQCGFCTPGMIMATQSLLYHNPKPTEDEIKIGLSGNLCRCTGYQMIIKAVKRASEVGEGLW
jgi:carbon-monoxide dehydrogenase small subunit